MASIFIVRIRSEVQYETLNDDMPRDFLHDDTIDDVSFSTRGAAEAALDALVQEHLNTWHGEEEEGVEDPPPTFTKHEKDCDGNGYGNGYWFKADDSNQGRAQIVEVVLRG